MHFDLHFQRPVIDWYTALLMNADSEGCAIQCHAAVFV